MRRKAKILIKKVQLFPIGKIAAVAAYVTGFIAAELVGKAIDKADVKMRKPAIAAGKFFIGGALAFEGIKLMGQLSDWDDDRLEKVREDIEMVENYENIDFHVEYLKNEVPSEYGQELYLEKLAEDLGVEFASEVASKFKSIYPINSVNDWLKKNGWGSVSPESEPDDITIGMYPRALFTIVKSHDSSEGELRPKLLKFFSNLSNHDISFQREILDACQAMIDADETVEKYKLNDFNCTGERIWH